MAQKIVAPTRSACRAGIGKLNQDIAVTALRRAPADERNLTAKLGQRCQQVGLLQQPPAIHRNHEIAVALAREPGFPASSRSGGGARPTTTRLSLETGTFLSANEALKLPDFA